MRSFEEWFDENCDGSDLAKDACRKLWNEFSDQINIICRKSYEKQQSKIDELQRRNQMLNDNIKEQGQKLVYQNEVIETQAEKLLGLRDEKAELQKKNAWLSDVAERENKRANKLQEEKVSTTSLLGKTIQEKNELQKRVDAALTILSSKKKMYVDMVIEIEQALKGGDQNTEKQPNKHAENIATKGVKGGDQ